MRYVYNQYLAVEKPSKTLYYPSVGPSVKDCGFRIPQQIKGHQAYPLLANLDESLQSLPESSVMTGMIQMQRFIMRTTDVYPKLFCAEVEEGRYMKFQFQFFAQVSGMDLPFIRYDAVELVGKEEAFRYQCIELE